ncbi:MAG: glycosyltransferase family 39 protein, partial [Bacteroidetes bacterium]|nr:glycosyltransferase family 39 protein [Bacteroidota bacterium]
MAFLDKLDHLLHFTRSERIWVLSILIFALMIRLVNYQQMKGNDPLFDIPVVDSKEYVEDANYYNDLNWLGPNEPYFHPPFYSYFVGSIFLVFGDSTNAVKLIQLLLELFNILLIYLIARRAFDNRTGFISMVIYALYVPVIFFGIQILPPVTLITQNLFTIWLFILFLDHSGTRKGTYYLLGSALVFGSLLINLPNFIFYLPIIGFILITLKQPLTKRLIFILLFGLIGLAPSILTAVRNINMSGDRIAISRNGGINLYIGNNPDLYETVHTAPGVEWEKLLMKPYEETPIHNFGEQDAFWYGKVSDYIMDDPLGWVKGMFMKTVLYLNGYEFSRNFDYHFFKKFSWVTSLPVFNLWLILPLGLLGIFFLVNDRGSQNSPLQMMLLSFFILYMLSIIIFFVSARYRLPALPLLIIFAGYASGIIWKRFREKGTSAILPWLGILAGLVIACNVNWFEEDYPYHVDPAHTYTLLAAEFINNKMPKKAGEYLDKGLKAKTLKKSCRDEIYYQLAHYYAAKGNFQKAAQNMLKAEELDPSNYQVHSGIALLHN